MIMGEDMTVAMVTHYGCQGRRYKQRLSLDDNFAE